MISLIKLKSKVVGALISNKSPKFDGGRMTAVKENRLYISLVECEQMESRNLLCPNCESVIQTLYGDVTGHLRFKCNKCKGEYTVNLKYFRRRKRPIYRREYQKRMYGIE